MYRLTTVISHAMLTSCTALCSIQSRAMPRQLIIMCSLFTQSRVNTRNLWPW